MLSYLMLGDATLCYSMLVCVLFRILRVVLGELMLCYVYMLPQRYAMLRHDTTLHVVSCHVMLCCVMLCHGMLCYVVFC